MLPRCPYVPRGSNLIVGFANPRVSGGIILPDGVNAAAPKYFTLVACGPDVTDLEPGDQIYIQESWPLPSEPTDPWLFLVVPSDKVSARGQRINLA